MAPKDTDINLARLEVHFENMKGHLARIEGSIGSLSKQLSDHAIEEMVVYARKEELGSIKEEVDMIDRNVQKIQDEVISVSNEVSGLLKKLAWIGGSIATLLSVATSVFVAYIVHIFHLNT